MSKRVYRSRKEKVLAGVGGGLAEYFNIDPTIVRIIMVLLAWGSVEVFVVGYILAAILIPERPKDDPGETDEPEVLDETGEPIKKTQDKRQVLGMIFVGAGGLMLLNRFTSWIDSGVILAIAVIAVGAYMLFKRDENKTA